MYRNIYIYIHTLANNSSAPRNSLARFALTPKGQGATAASHRGSRRARWPGPDPGGSDRSRPPESESKPGTKMVNPEPYKGLRRRISAAIYGWDRPLLPFIYPGFDCDSARLKHGLLCKPGSGGINKLYPMKDTPRIFAGSQYCLKGFGNETEGNPWRKLGANSVTSWMTR